MDHFIEGTTFVMIMERALMTLEEYHENTLQKKTISE